MAQDARAKVYLGYEDESVTEKHRTLVNFTTNKIGGKPVSVASIVLLLISSLFLPLTIHFQFDSAR